MIGVLVGIPLYSVVVTTLFRTNLVYTARNKDGTIKKTIPISGILTSLFLLFGITFLQIAINYFGKEMYQGTIPWWRAFFIDHFLFIILFIYDTFVIDYLVIIKWRPKFLRLPESMDLESMKTHIKASIRIGIPFGLLITGLSVVLSVLFI